MESDLKVVVKGKGDDFLKNPAKTLSELGLLKQGETFKVTYKAGVSAAAAASSCGHGCAFSVEAEYEKAD